MTTLRRTDFALLELAFLRDPVAFTGVSMFQSMINDAKADIFSDDAKTDANIQDFLGQAEEFESSFYEFAPLHLYIFGNAWVEHVQNSRGMTLDFSVANPILMDYQREVHSFRNGQVSTDGLGRERGYVQWNRQLGYENVTFPRNRMTHLFYMKVKTGDIGYGPVEAMFQDITLKENIERALTAQAFAQAFPKPIVTYGETDSAYSSFQPSADLRKMASYAAADIVDNGVDYMVIPPYLKVERWEIGEIQPATIEYLRHILQFQAGVMGIPLALLLQTGGGNSSEIETLMDQFATHFRADQKKLKLDKVITQVLKNNKLNPVGVKVKYGKVSEREFKEASLRVFRVLKGINAMSPEILEKMNIGEMMSNPEWCEKLEEIAGIGREKGIIA